MYIDPRMKFIRVPLDWAQVLGEDLLLPQPSKKTKIIRPVHARVPGGTCLFDFCFHPHRMLVCATEEPGRGIMTTTMDYRGQRPLLRAHEEAFYHKQVLAACIAMELGITMYLSRDQITVWQRSRINQEPMVALDDYNVIGVPPLHSALSYDNSRVLLKKPVRRGHWRGSAYTKWSWVRWAFQSNEPDTTFALPFYR